MANAVYPKYKEAALGAGANLLTGDVKAALIDTGTYTYSALHDFWDDVSAGVIGTPVSLTTKSVTDGKFDSDNVTWTAVSGATAEAIVLFIDTGTPATSRVVAYIDAGQTGLPVTPNGGDINFTVDAANGWFTL